ncbi:hypothetical protein D9M70_447110 [compost metagenome]
MPGAFGRCMQPRILKGDRGELTKALQQFHLFIAELERGGIVIRDAEHTNDHLAGFERHPHDRPNGNIHLSCGRSAPRPVLVIVDHERVAGVPDRPGHALASGQPLANVRGIDPDPNHALECLAGLVHEIDIAMFGSEQLR